jgi:pimeloyl-ACP methyl ester carboxylesterase
MAQHMCGLNPRVTAIEIPDAGHYIHDDQPELFAQAVCGFLKAEPTR